MIATPRLVRVPPFERGITLGDFLVPIRVGERATSRQRHLLMIGIGVLLIFVGARLSFYLPDNPFVPVSLQTFGVLFGSALLGFRRAILAVAVYLVLGVVGLPVFAYDATTDAYRSGLATIVTVQQGDIILGGTGGYLLGFLAAAALVGRLAELGWDRNVPGSLLAMALGNALIYAIGLPWLALAADFEFQTALARGLYPFVAFDLLKLALAAGLMPLGWWLVRRRSSER
ncbi:MAG: biotin transporter BioY [Chloroflexi bacterium]|nr:biotin transporter BioY [Chloroflexota bacterium]